MTRCPDCQRPLTAAGLPAEHAPGCTAAAAWGEDLLRAARAAATLGERWQLAAKSLVVSGYQCVLRGEPAAAALAALLDPAFVIALVEGVRSRVPAPQPVPCCRHYEKGRGCCPVDHGSKNRHPRQDHEGDGPCVGCEDE